MTNDPGQNADREQFLHEWIQQHSHEVWNYAYLITRNPALADDVMQDTWIKAYQKFDTFRGEASIKTWLFAIARNVAYDYRRSAYLRRVLLVDRIGERHEQQGAGRGMQASAEKEFFDRMATEDVWNEVLRLPAKLREVLVLSVTHRMSSAEISALLGIAEATVRTRLHRAKAKMSQRLQEVTGHEHA